MAEFMVDELDLTKFLAQLENGRYGIDEQLLATLQADDQIGAPGGFTLKCADEGHRTDCATRYGKQLNIILSLLTPNF